MENDKFKNLGGGATLLTARSVGFWGIRWGKLLRYYGTKALRSNSRVRNVGRLDKADRKAKRFDIMPKTNYNSNMMNYKSRNNNESEAHSKNLVPYCLSNLVSSQKAAFTLAEVLITLGIIGVVAAMTIPTLISNYQEKQTVTALKKAYSTLSQAYKMAVIESGVSSRWSYPTASKDAHLLLFEKLKPFLRVNETCLFEAGCMADSYKSLDGKNTLNYGISTNYPKAVLSDGMSVLFSSYGNSYKDFSSRFGWDSKNYATGTLLVDINGKSGPNITGRDIFTFILTDNGILPNGQPTRNYYYEDEDGEEIQTTDPMTNCNRTKCAGQCEACAAWVIEQENLDYLHCDDLSWDGKFTCN